MRYCIQVVCRRDYGGLVAPTSKIIGKRGFTKVQKNLSLDIFIFVHFWKIRNYLFGGDWKNISFLHCWLPKQFQCGIFLRIFCNFLKNPIFGGFPRIFEIFRIFYKKSWGTCVSVNFQKFVEKSLHGCRIQSRWFILRGLHNKRCASFCKIRIFFV